MPVALCHSALKQEFRQSGYLVATSASHSRACSAFSFGCIIAMQAIRAPYELRRVYRSTIEFWLKARQGVWLLGL